jgi:hypothetical protein
MPKTIYYVGLKTRENGGETAFISETQIRWFLGDSHPIADNVASRMLAHPDVFSDKSPEERARLAEEARQRAAEEQAAARNPGNSGGSMSMEAFLAALPAGAKITLPNGTEIKMPVAGNAGATTPVYGSLEGAHTSSVAARLAAHTGANNEDGQPTTALNAGVGDATGFGEGDRVTETKVGESNTAGMSLAPGATVASIPVDASGKVLTTDQATANTGPGTATATDGGNGRFLPTSRAQAATGKTTKAK